MSSMFLDCIQCTHVLYVLGLHPMRACTLCSWIAFYARIYSMFLDSLLYVHVLYVLG